MKKKSWYVDQIVFYNDQIPWDKLKMDPKYLKIPSKEVMIQLPMRFIVKGCKWLEEIFKLVVEYNKARALLPDELWKRYETWDWEDLNSTEEAIILKQATKNLKNLLKKRDRPLLFRSSKVKDVLKQKIR